MIDESFVSLGVLQPEILDDIGAATAAAAHTDNIGTLWGSWGSRVQPITD